MSDRFGVWLGFHACDRHLFHDRGYCAALDIQIDREELRARAKEWTVTRGSRSVRGLAIRESAGD